ncbi:MAG: hypothetical protein RSE93_05580, partial [Oscillospiraceae bacterium]
LEGDFTLDGGDFYVGNLQAGYNDYFENSIIPTGEGEQKGAIVLKYEDSQGNLQEKRQEFTINVMPMPEVNPDDMMGGDIGAMGPDMQVKKGMPIWAWIVISGVGIAVIIVAIVIIKKKRKAKLVGADNEED